jgi:uncharacterized protein DUF559
MPIDLSAPFRGSTAIAAGLLTPGVLRGRRYRRLFPDVYAPAVLEVDLALRARAAGVLVAGRGVVAGYAAAELWGASCGPADAPVDVLLPHDRRCDGLRVHRERIDPDEITWLGPTLVTTADRAAFDLARWAPDLTERVAAVDALRPLLQGGTRRDPRAAEPAPGRASRRGHRTGAGPRRCSSCVTSGTGGRGRGTSPNATGSLSPPASSPWQRSRTALHLGGLPAPVVQHPVIARGTRYYLDLAYPEVRLAIEYDGAEHRTQRRARRDLMREAALTALGWHILRFDADVVLYRPDRLVDAVRTELAVRGVL